MTDQELEKVRQLVSCALTRIENTEYALEDLARELQDQQKMLNDVWNRLENVDLILVDLLTDEESIEKDK